MTVQMSNKTRTSEVNIAKTIKIMMGQQQRNMGLQAPVQRPSPGDHAAYLHAEMPTSISLDSPHDNTHDEQQKTQVRGQYRENHQNHDVQAAAQYEPASPCAEATTRRTYILKCQPAYRQKDNTMTDQMSKKNACPRSVSQKPSKS